MTVHEAFDALFEAVLSNRDAEAFIALWSGEDDITMWGSDLDEQALGRDEIHALGQAIATSEHSLEFRWDEVRVHEEGYVAWVNAAGAIIVDHAEHPYRLTAVLLRSGDDWLWHTFSGSIPD